MGGARIDTTAPTGGAIDSAAVDTAAVDTATTRDTTDTSDTSGVRNPPGYQGMERDTTVFPDSSGSHPSAGNRTPRAIAAWRNRSTIVPQPIPDLPATRCRGREAIRPARFRTAPSSRRLQVVTNRPGGYGLIRCFGSNNLALATAHRAPTGRTRCRLLPPSSTASALRHCVAHRSRGGRTTGRKDPAGCGRGSPRSAGRC